MIIKINGKEYEMFFGFDFIDYVNNASGLAFQGVQFGIAGMKLMMTGMADKSPSAFRTMIKAGTNTLKSKPSNEDLENYIEELLENGKYEEMFDEVVEEMGKHVIILKEMGISKEDWLKAIEEDKKAKQEKEVKKKD